MLMSVSESRCRRPQCDGSVENGRQHLQRKRLSVGRNSPSSSTHSCHESILAGSFSTYVEPSGHLRFCEHSSLHDSPRQTIRRHEPRHSRFASMSQTITCRVTRRSTRWQLREPGTGTLGWPPQGRSTLGLTAPHPILHDVRGVHPDGAPGIGMGSVSGNDSQAAHPSRQPRQQ